MRKFGWFVLGVAGGFVVAHLVNKDPRGHEMLSQVDSRINEFTDRIGDAYRDQEAQFADLVAETRTAAAGSVAAIADAASDVKDAAAKVANDSATAAKNAAAPTD
ncbi:MULTISPECIES: ATPase [unclassified Microbacterium]|uniref:ATPase n=1 Tax=unclassified Microbacterium TaxID=2609290 RepID=UPI00374715D8